MLLKWNLSLAILLLSGCASLAGTEPPPPRMINYVLDTQASVLDESQKRNMICPDFKLEEGDILAGKTLSLGALYIFNTKSSRPHRSEPEVLDGIECNWVEENQRQNLADGRVKLRRLNEEYCKNRNGQMALRSRTTAEVVIADNQIEMRYHILGAEPYSCVWKPQP